MIENAAEKRLTTAALLKALREHRDGQTERPRPVYAEEIFKRERPSGCDPEWEESPRP
jgi:hypothetical protein